MLVDDLMYKRWKSAPGRFPLSELYRIRFEDAEAFH